MYRRIEKFAAKERAKAERRTLRLLGTHFFCDGACEPNPGAGGWGVVFCRDGREIISNSGGLVETTNNAMELTGMLVAIEMAKTGSGHDGQLVATIWCDFAYVVNGCKDWLSKWRPTAGTAGR